LYPSATAITEVNNKIPSFSERTDGGTEESKKEKKNYYCRAFIGHYATQRETGNFCFILRIIK
jgi:hypothetical protein